MRKWFLQKGDPLHLTLAADARLSRAVSGRTAEWELKLGGGEPPALAVESSLNLLARQMRVFTAIRYGSKYLTDPVEFYSRPYIDEIYPNYASLIFLPFQELEVREEFWVPSGNIMAGNVTCRNIGQKLMSFSVVVSALMEPMVSGRPMAVGQVGINWILFGRTDTLHIVCIMAERVNQASWFYPGLQVPVILNSNDSQSYRWAVALGATQEEALKRAREVCACNWRAEVERVEMLNESQAIEIETGDPAWDAALMFSQNCAFQLIQPGNDPDNGSGFKIDVLNKKTSLPKEPHPITTRKVSPLSAMELYYYSALIPGAAEIPRKLLEQRVKNLFQDDPEKQVQTTLMEGSSIHDQPLLATIAVQLAEAQGDWEWLRSIYPFLLNHFLCWFDPSVDVDQDGWPEWPGLALSGQQGNKLVDFRCQNGQGYDIQWLESPALASMIYKEGLSLIEIANQLGYTDGLEKVTTLLKKLKICLDQAWNTHKGMYTYRDAVAHTTPKGGSIVKGMGGGKIRVAWKMETTTRVILRIRSADSRVRPVQVMLHGKRGKKVVEEYISHLRFSWNNGIGTATSAEVFDHLSWVQLKGMDTRDSYNILVPDLAIMDASLFLPLWARIVDPERAVLLAGNIKKKYITPSGIGDHPTSKREKAEAVIDPTRNHLITLGLLSYDERNLSARIMTRLLDCFVACLKRSNAFFEKYAASDHSGIGERDTITGLVPVGSFLKTIGIEILRPNEVWVRGYNPFRLPTVVQYRGMKIVREKDLTKVIFKNGQQIIHHGRELKKISTSKDEVKGEE